ncbi:MAG: DNA polymerase III subunit delta [Bacteroidaceae bacterium]|nr:DNA polymerase III subunit delta [Bacteroidaceae bacterium]
MLFKNIYGQEQVKQRLLTEIREGRIAHAQMFNGPAGNGAFALALAYARLVLCKKPTEDDACGQCQSCLMVDRLEHPDLHFVFPIFKRGDKDTLCNEFIKEWKEMVMENPYFDLNDWMSKIDSGNKQLTIYRSESESIVHKMSMKSNQGGYKVMIIWLPERMNDTCANKILKMVEEPYPKTLFLFITEDVEAVLPTIRSRTQIIDVPAFTQPVIEQALTDMNVLPEEAKIISRACEGNMAQTLRVITSQGEDDDFIERFKQLMRMAYVRNVKALKVWSEEVADMNREQQKNFIAYCQRMVRENFIYNFHQPDLNYMRSEEAQFAVKFAPFINEKNVIGIMEELELVQFHLERNVNPKVVLFDFALKLIVLIKNR